MNQLSDIAAWRDVFLHAAAALATRVAAFLPNLIGAVLLLLVGWLLAWAIEIVASRALHAFGVDRIATRLRVSDILKRAGLQVSFSGMIARLLFWLTMLAFLLSSVHTLGLGAVTATIDRLVAYVPSLVGAGLITLFGLLLARFIGTLVSSAAAAAGFPNARRLGLLVQILLAGLVFVVAVEQLGIETDVLVGPLTAVLAAAGFAAGLAFALGAYPIVTHILAGHFLKESLPRDVFVEIGGERGIVERIGATDTLLRNGEQSWSVPNAKLLDLVVRR